MPTDRRAPNVNPPLGNSSVEQVIAAAESALGTMYRWGGNSLATGVDCSGLVQQAFRAAGINLPRVSADQARMGDPVGSIEQAQPGDLISYDNSGRNNGADHIAIYIGNGMMIESPKAGVPVRVTKVRAGGSINRVLGVVQPTPGVKAGSLGNNGDRTYTTAVMNGTAMPAAKAASLKDPGGGVGDDLPPDATPQQIDAYIRQHYADVAPFLQNEEIKKLAYDAALNDLAPDELTHRFEQTTYYQTHGQASRSFDELLGRDKATAGVTINKAKGIISDLFHQNDIQADDFKIGEAAKQAIRNGWITLQGAIQDPQGLNDFAVFLRGGKAGGVSAATADELGALAKQYMVPMARTDLERWALEIQSGSKTQEQFQHDLLTHAKGLFGTDPDMIARLDGGQSPWQAFAPIRATIGKFWDLDPDSIDLTDPKFSDFVQMYDEKTKTKRAPTLGEAQALAMKKAPTDSTWYKQTEGELTANLRNFVGATK